MNWNQIEGNWKQVKGNAKAEWGKLTDDEVAEMNGNREALIGKLQEKYGETREAVERKVDQWADKI